jgi:hypothetical protein
LLDATETYRQNDEVPVLRPKDRDGLVVPRDILVALIACCEAPEPDRSDLIRYAEYQLVRHYENHRSA